MANRQRLWAHAFDLSGHHDKVPVRHGLGAQDALFGTGRRLWCPGMRAVPAGPLGGRMCPSPLFAPGCLADARGTVGVRGPPGGGGWTTGEMRGIF